MRLLVAGASLLCSQHPLIAPHGRLRCDARRSVRMDVEESTDWTIASMRLAEVRRQHNPPDDECVIDAAELCDVGGPKVVLLRHGESAWNDADRFTGWHDVPLSARGAQQAVDAAQILRDEGLCFDAVYCSKLKRTIKTAWLLLEELDSFNTPIIQSWQLNERMYGALTGLNKAATKTALGEMMYEELRREPPPLDSDSCYDPDRSPVAREVPLELRPRKESFEDTLQRVMPYWEHDVLPGVMESGGTVLIISSKNLLRSLIQGMTKMPMEQAVELDIPNGLPLVYDVNSGTLKAVGPEADSWPRKAATT